MIRCPRMRMGSGTISFMRFRSLHVFWSLVLASFPLLATAAIPCTPSPRVPGTPIDAPHAVFEAYVVEVHTPHASTSTFGVLRTRRALVEVVRSYHGPYGPGQQVETLSIEGANACGDLAESGAHVLVRSESGGPFEIVETFPKGEFVPNGPFASLARLTGEPGHSRRPSLKNVSLRGEIDGALAAQLHERARLDAREHCEISSTGNYAQVSWGKAFGGNDARNKVIFERVDDQWVEILRYEAPTPSPARDRARRGKQRSLWAEIQPGRRIGRFDVVIPPFNT